MRTLLLVELKIQRIAVKGRRDPLAKSQPHLHGTELLLPRELAFQVVNVYPTRAEERDYMLPVRNRCVRGEAPVAAVIALMRDALRRLPFPKDLSTIPVQAQQAEAVLFAEPCSPARASSGSAAAGTARLDIA